MAKEVHVEPDELARVARRWHGQHLELRAAAAQIGGAATGGFSAGVAGAAAQFAEAWQHHVGALAGDGEALADGLRLATRGILASDAGAVTRSSRLLSQLAARP